MQMKESQNMNTANTGDLEKLRYPVGKYIKPENITSKHIEEWISVIELFPARLREVMKDQGETELNWRYRPGGWTIQQVVHHCADSHLNALVRFKLALTEDLPTIKPYLEAKWAELPDVSDADVSDSIHILEGLHPRWTKLLKSLGADDLKKEYFHPERNRNVSLEETVGLYAWHCNHHLAHIKQALKYKGRFDV